MLQVLRRLTPRARRDRLPSRKVRSEIEALKRWARRSPADRVTRED
jgi:hypothetical protein